jgi:tRNA threonylcarbamoyladenosine biosynthesis protein TsaB
VANTKAIAIETSGRAGSVALAEDGRVVAEEVFPHDLKHAAGVVAVIDRLVRGVGWTPKDLNAVYVSAGPGSFTGLRVGVTVAKTLALSLGVKVVAVPTAAVLARNAPAGWRNVLIVLDAKRGQIFTARFEKVGDEIREAEGAHLDTLEAMLARSPREGRQGGEGGPVHLIGEGIPYHRQSIPEDAGVVVTPEESWRARAAVVVEIGYAMARAGEFADADKLAPVYIRRPEAEEKWEQTKGTARG